MKKRENRRFIRQDSLHLLDYLVVDSEGQPSTYSMGRTLDISENGMLMETMYPIPRGSSLVITLGIEDNLMDISGQLTHTGPIAGRYASGIEFIRVDKEGRKVLNRYIELFQARKSELLTQNDYP